MKCSSSKVVVSGWCQQAYISLDSQVYVSFIEHSENVSYGKAPNGSIIKSPCLDWRNTTAICFFTLMLGCLRWASLASYTETPG